MCHWRKAKIAIWSLESQYTDKIKLQTTMPCTHKKNITQSIPAIRPKGEDATMRIIEKFLASKTNDMAHCEDGIYIGQHYIAVIDGVTTKGKLLWNGKTSGYYAKEIIMHALDDLEGKESLEDVFQYINSVLRKSYENTDFFEKNPEERLQATIVIYSIHKAQIWRYGDCQYMVNDKAYTYEMKIDTLLSELRSVFLRLEMLRGVPISELSEHDPSQDILFPILKRQFLFSNKDCDYGFPVLDGFCQDFSFIETTDVPPDSVVILATDGYPKIHNSLAESEKYLCDLKQDDPLCITLYKSTRGFTNGKSSLDDRAYIKFQT